MTTSERTESPRLNSGRLTLYHANSKGTGAAMRLELRLDKGPESRDNCFFLELANQRTAATHSNGERAHATFDWENKATVKLGFSDVCEFLAVLEGRQEQAGGSRSGLYHEASGTNTIIVLKPGINAGYLLGISKKDAASSQVFKGHIQLSDVEAIGLRSIFQVAIFHLAFHQSLLAAAMEAPARARAHAAPMECEV